MTAFRVTFECNNCGHQWTEDFEKGDEVRGSGSFSGPYMKSNNCTFSVSCPHCRDITCPVCDVGEDVRVVKREPCVAPTAG